MNICKDCFSASTDWSHDGYTKGCDKCNIRGISNSKKLILDYFLNTLEKNEGVNKAEEIRAIIKSEQARIKRLRVRNED